MAIYLFENFPQTAGKVLQTHCEALQPQSSSAGSREWVCLWLRQCVAAARPLRTASLEVSRCCVLPCSQRTEWKGYCCHQLVFIGGLFVGCADLASAPSGGAWNKSFAGGNALELPTQDYLLGRSVVPQLSVRGEHWMLETRDTASKKLMFRQGHLVHSHYQLPGLCINVLVFWHCKLSLVNVGEIVGIWIFCICQYLIQGANKNYPGVTSLFAFFWLGIVCLQFYMPEQGFMCKLNNSSLLFP